MPPEIVLAPQASLARPAAPPRRPTGSGGTWRRLLALALLLGAWEAYGRHVDNDLVFPSFTETLRALIETTLSGELPLRIGATLRSIVVGYAIGVALALLLTGLAAGSRFGTDLLSLLTAMFNPLPAIALMPLALLWFGLGNTALIFVTAQSVLWAVALNALSGFRAISPTLRMAGLNLGLSGWRLLYHILLPAALPSLLAGLKIGWAYAWRTLIAAELVFGATSRSGGLGWFIAEHRNELEIDKVFAGLLAVILVGLAIEIGVFQTIERRTVLRWGMQR